MLRKVFLFYRTVNVWSASNDEAVASLLQTLKELKSDLLSTPASQVRKTAYVGQLSVKLFCILWVAVHIQADFCCCCLFNFLFPPPLPYLVKYSEEKCVLPWGRKKDILLYSHCHSINIF